MATIRERRTREGELRYQAIVRRQGFPERVETFSTKRKAERWVRLIEGEMEDGRHFRSAEAKRKSLADAIERYVRDEVPKKRDGEMHRTTLKWWKAELGHLKRVLFRETKNATPRAAWLAGPTLELLKEHGKVRKIDPDTLVFEATGKCDVYEYHAPFRMAVDAAGLANLRFHDLRHSAATYLAQQGATEQQLRAIGGWKSNIVNRYVHLAAEDSKAALEKLAEKIVD